jgi:hypothetical protein
MSSRNLPFFSFNSLLQRKKEKQQGEDGPEIIHELIET